MNLLITLLDVLRALVLIDVVLSWIVQDPNQFPRSITSQITRPLYAPFQKLLPPEKTGGFDLAPIGVFLAIGLVKSALY